MTPSSYLQTMAAHEDELCVALTRIALAGDGVVLGIGMTVLALRTWLKYRAHSKALKELEETPLSRIADLRSLGDGSNQERARIILHDDDSERVETNPQFPFSSLLWQRRRRYTTQPQELSTKQQQEKAAAAAIVMVRGRVQSKACVEESKHKTEHDTGALTAENDDEKAVYLERTQTVRPSYSSSSSSLHSIYNHTCRNSSSRNSLLFLDVTTMLSIILRYCVCVCVRERERESWS